MYRLKHERGQKFGAGHVIDILLGKKTQRVIDQDHASLKVFGIGDELSDGEWRGVVRQLLAQGLLAVEGDYGTLTLTPASAEVLAQAARGAAAPRARAGPVPRGAARPGPAAAAAAADMPAAARAGVRAAARLAGGHRQGDRACPRT